MSNRESFVQTVQICDDQTGDLISLTDTDDNPIYEIYLEISEHRDRNSRDYSPVASPYYDDCGDPLIFASLDDYISIVDTGTIDVQIPYTVMQKLRGNLTYDIFMRLENQADEDARQLFIGSLPVLFGGRGP